MQESLATAWTWALAAVASPETAGVLDGWAESATLELDFGHLASDAGLQVLQPIPKQPMTLLVAVEAAALLPGGVQTETDQQSWQS